MRMAVVVVVLMHMALFAGILFNACKQKDEAKLKGNREGNGGHREPAARTGALAGADDLGSIADLAGPPECGFHIAAFAH